MKGRKTHRRGYAVALLLGLENNRAVLWQVYSQVVKQIATLNMVGARTDENASYNFHETIVGAMKPALRGGVKSVVVVAPMKTDFAAEFLKHVNKHHGYLCQPGRQSGMTFRTMVGSAGDVKSVSELVRTHEFRDAIVETTSEETNQIVAMLEKQLSARPDTSVVFSLEEIENIVYAHETSGIGESTYLVLTDSYLSSSPQKNRIQRLVQICQNKHVKTKVINSESLAGKRLSQFGGIALFNAQPEL